MDSLCHQCITTSHLSYSVLSLKLPPPPCAALLGYDQVKGQCAQILQTMQDLSISLQTATEKGDFEALLWISLWIYIYMWMLSCLYLPHLLRMKGFCLRCSKTSGPENVPSGFPPLASGQSRCGGWVRPGSNVLMRLPNPETQSDILSGSWGCLTWGCLGVGTWASMFPNLVVVSRCFRFTSQGCVYGCLRSMRGQQDFRWVQIRNMTHGRKPGRAKDLTARESQLSPGRNQRSTWCQLMSVMLFLQRVDLFGDDMYLGRSMVNLVALPFPVLNTCGVFHLHEAWNDIHWGVEPWLQPDLLFLVREETVWFVDSQSPWCHFEGTHMPLLMYTCFNNWMMNAPKKTQRVSANICFQFYNLWQFWYPEFNNNI